jgi:transcriptional regulator GlxA family with amidase domain
MSKQNSVTGDFVQRRMAFILTADHSLMSLASAVEPLRAANRQIGHPFYHITYILADGARSKSSAGARFEGPDLTSAGYDFDVAFVVAGGEPMIYQNQALSQYLRQLSVRRVTLGGISGGGVLLARFGLMSGRRFTVHWRHVEELRKFDDTLLLEQDLFVIDRDRFSCAGGAAAIDMMYAILARDHGVDFARAVLDWFVYTDVRPAAHDQRSEIAAKYGIRDPVVLAATRLMKDHVADPLSLSQLSRLLGQNPRHMQRLFKSETGASVMEFYRSVRLEIAHELAAETVLPIYEIGIACGFDNAAHFSQAFNKRYGMAPSDLRQKTLMPSTAQPVASSATKPRVI